MSMKEIDLIVTNRDKKESEGKTKYVLKLKHPDGHYLVLKADTETLFEGFPINHMVRIVISNPQTTLKKP